MHHWYLVASWLWAAHKRAREVPISARLTALCPCGSQGNHALVDHGISWNTNSGISTQLENYAILEDIQYVPGERC